jgi:diguanylate cyclase (GGDEF)-like protein
LASHQRIADGGRAFVDHHLPAVLGTPVVGAPNVREILNSVGDVPYEWDVASDIIRWGENACDVFGLLDVAFIASGKGFAALIDTACGGSRYDAVFVRAAVLDDGRGVPYQVQYALRAPGRAKPLWVEDTGRWFAGPDGRPQRAHGVVRVINERYEKERDLQRLSRFDALTDEMNRARLMEVLQLTIDNAVKLRLPCCFMLAAVDNLDRINEAYGYEIADQVIAAVSKRIRSYLRGKDHLGRFSGNSLGIILHDCILDDMQVAADRLLVGVRNETFETDAGPVAATVTIGGVSIPRHARGLGDALARAQTAIDGAKGKRRGSFQAYLPNPEREAQRRRNVDLTRDMIAALNERRIVLSYEPIVAVTTRQPALYECLMRIRQPDGTLLPTSEVMALAERLGHVRLLDHRILELVLDELIKAPALKVSMNISAASTVDPDWWSSLNAMLRFHHGVGERLTIEITESAAIQDLDETRGFVTRVRDLGCRIAIDDFGAGYTSFRNLRKLGVDMVKIDGAFVQNIRRSKDDRVFVHALIDLSRKLGLETVAEWVQDEEAAAMLADWGCNYLQGALLGLASQRRPWQQELA